MRSISSKTFYTFIPLILIFLFSSLCLPRTPHEYFKIKVIDEETGRGIPLVEIRTQSWIRHFTDSNGLVAFYEPGLMGQDCYLFIESEGYEYPKDILGNAGFVINPSKEDSVIIKMRRVNLAERLYRITGPGIYRDSYLLGVPAPIMNPLLNGKVLGQDSNLSLKYKGKIFWVWGDTFKPSYPWGNFSISAASSKTQENGGLSPELGVDLNYFVDTTGFSKSMIVLEGKGYVWFDWLMTIPDASGNEKLVAKYARVKMDFRNHERGIAVYNDQKEMFEKHKQVDAWIDEYHSTHHPIRAKMNGQEFAIVTSEFAFSRVQPTLVRVSDPTAYESFTCLKPGEKYNKENPALDRDESGKLIWDWKKNTDVINLTRQNELVESNVIRPGEKWLFFQEIGTGESLLFRRGSIYWNDYRQRWILIVQKDMGEVWYAEGDTPTGPWVFAKKVITHNQYFYNPVHHPFFDQEKGKIIYFEGTYTNIFNANPVIKPRYEYNQLMYRLSLDDERLFMPVSVYTSQKSNKKIEYQLKETVDKNNSWGNVHMAGFLAYPPDRPLKNLVPIYQTSNDIGPMLSTVPKGELLFYALPVDEVKYESFLGTWLCKMTDGIFINREFNLKLESEKNNLQSSVGEAGYSVENLSTNGALIDFTINYVDKTYYFKGEVGSGLIKGSWTASDSVSTGTWESENIDHNWQPSHSPLLTPLYIYTNRNASDWFYAVDLGLEYQTYTRSDVAICRVWKNPATNIKIEPAIRADK